MKFFQKIGITVLFFLFALNLTFSDNLFSRLQFSSANQFGVPLENVSFSIECTSDRNPYPTFPLNGKSFACSTDKTGKCFPEICYACPANSEVKVYAKYYATENYQVIWKWAGYSSESGFPGTCSYFKSPPSNDLSPFTFSTYTLGVNLKDQNNEYVSGATVTVGSTSGFYTTCIADNLGTCMIYNIPEDAYNVKASYQGTENQTSINLDADKVINLRLDKSNLRLTFNFLDKQNQPLSGVELYVYSVNKNKYLVSKISASSTEYVSVSQGDNINYLVKYRGTVVKSDQFVARTNSELNVTVGCDRCQDGSCSFYCPSTNNQVNNNPKTAEVPVIVTQNNSNESNLTLLANNNDKSVPTNPNSNDLLIGLALGMILVLALLGVYLLIKNRR